MATRNQQLTALVNVTAIVIGAWLSASTVDAMVASHYSSSLPAATPAGNHLGALYNAASPVDSKGVDYYLATIKSHNIFNHGEPIPDEDLPASLVNGAVDVNAPAEACTLPIQLMMTFAVKKDPSLSLATIMDSSSTPPAVVVAQVGERVANLAVLVSVGYEFDDVTLKGVDTIELRRDDGRKEICRSDAGSKPVGAGGATLSALTPATIPPPGNGVKCNSPTSCTVDRGTIDGIINGGLSAIAETVRIVPAPNGFKLDYVKPGSLLSSIGLQRGDVVQKINGYDMNSPEKALQVYGLLKNEKSLSVDINCNGANQSISYTIQ